MTYRKPHDDDRFSLSPRAALYVEFLNAGYDSDTATDLASEAMEHPDKLLEDIRPQTPRLLKI